LIQKSEHSGNMARVSSSFWKSMKRSWRWNRIRLC